MSTRNERTKQQLDSAASETEYRHLTSYFHSVVKYTMGGLTIIFTLAGVLFYKSVQDMREDVAQTAKRIALEESKARVEEAFEENSINILIDKTATKKIDSITDKQIENRIAAKLKPLTERIELFGRISASETRMRMGFRSGYNELREIISSTQDDQVKRFALSSMNTTAQHFELVWNRNREGETAFAMLKSIDESAKTLPDVVRLIRNESQMNVVAVAYLAFREITGTKTPMFDLAAVDKWCENNKPKCNP